MMLVKWISCTKSRLKTLAIALIATLCLMFIYRVSCYVGQDTSTECAWSIAIIVVCWLLSSALYLVFDTSRFNGFITAFLVSSSIRMLLTCACIVMLLKYGDIRKYVLLTWSGVMYLLLLLVDTYLNVSYLQSLNKARKDFFSDNENELDISNRQPARRNNE